MSSRYGIIATPCLMPEITNYNDYGYVVYQVEKPGGKLEIETTFLQTRSVLNHDCPVKLLDFTRDYHRIRKLKQKHQQTVDAGFGSFCETPEAVKQLKLNYVPGFVITNETRKFGEALFLVDYQLRNNEQVKNHFVRIYLDELGTEYITNSVKLTVLGFPFQQEEIESIVFNLNSGMDAAETLARELER